MPVYQHPLTDRQKRDKFADLAESYANSATKSTTITAMDALLAKAQVYATLALAYKD